MPFITIKTNKQLTSSDKIALKTDLGQAISILPGKTEQWLMLSFESSDMYFKGSADACCIAEVKIYGSARQNDYDKLTSTITEIINKTLAIEPDRIYVAYFETSIWGYNGTNF